MKKVILFLLLILALSAPTWADLWSSTKNTFSFVDPEKQMQKIMAASSLEDPEAISKIESLIRSQENKINNPGLGSNREKELNNMQSMVNAVDDRGYCPLLFAVHQGNLAIVQLLVDYGADCDTYLSYDAIMNTTPFFEACASGNIEIINYIFSRTNNFDTEVKVITGGEETTWTPLSLLITKLNESKSYTDIIINLIDRGADTNVTIGSSSLIQFLKTTYDKNDKDIRKIINKLKEKGAEPELTMPPVKPFPWMIVPLIIGAIVIALAIILILRSKKYRKLAGNFFKHNIIVIFILIMIFISFSVEKQNEATVDKLVDDTTKTFITVSIVKGSVDIIEGSTLLGIEMGDIVQPVLDYVNIIWKFLLCALTFWGCFKLFITLPAIAAIMLLLVALIAYIANKAIAKYMLFCSFICSLIPFIIFTTGILMHVCTEPLRLEAQQHFDEVSEIFSLDGLERELSTSIIKQTKTNIAFFTEKAKEIIKNKKMIMGNMASGTWKYAVVLLMNSLIIPGLFFLFFFKLGKVLQSEDEKKIIIQNIKPELEPKLLTAK